MTFRVCWRLHSAMQGDYEMLVGVAKALEIDAVSSVPHLPDDVSKSHASKLLADWALDSSKGENEWQRRPDTGRINSIKNFADSSPENLIVNSVMLYVPPNASGVTIERDEDLVTVEIDMTAFLEPIGAKLTDVSVHEDEEGEKTFTDHRPIWLVDGQHRTRGLSLSQLGSEKNIPIIVLHSEEHGGVSQTMVAKIFTEINTLAKPLDSYQARYLGFKHSIASGDRRTTYASFDDPDTNLDQAEIDNRRANRMIYELAAKLNLIDDGPFESGVQLADGMGPAKMAKVKLEPWIDVTRSWFITGIYGDHSIGIDQVFQELNDYFQAWSETVNHDEYTFMPGVTRWNPYYGGNVSTLDRPNHVKIVMIKIFPWIKEILGLKGLSTDTGGFKTLLSPLKYVDWYDTNFNSGNLVGAGEPPAGWLQIWVKQAILNGIQWPLDEVNSSDPTLVNHGRALHAQPSEPDFQFVRGATTNIFQLSWSHGNVFKAPSVVSLKRPGQPDVEINDGQWEEIQSDPLHPIEFRFSITIETSLLDTDGNGIIDDDDDWSLEVVATNLSPIPATTLTYSPQDL